eukprot:CAMPEP_0172421712 /NCGR_PEP_ID=MMETSP1064-20121228/7935_1 /TAXON_ID=202472 /ORGANISM="Aulacoseira subarctica , Strain CCAP 1002/5" /LENGTH=236 /DNA_ID=CAMNT_0013162241 /DNA_START=46 /DNA_END=756 /DNA_ORIENTATION=-
MITRKKQDSRDRPKATSLPVGLVSDKKTTAFLHGSNAFVEELCKGAVFFSHNFFTADECKAWIEFAEQIGFEKLSHPQSRYIAQRECGRIQLKNWEMAAKIFARLHPIILQCDRLVPDGFSGNRQPVGCNGNIRLYKYERGMSFGKHVDEANIIPEFPSGRTEMTVLIYLSDCIGGATRFFRPTKKRNDEGIGFTPKAGSILLHVHGDRCLEHSADSVVQGVKYVLRADVVYGAAR